MPTNRRYRIRSPQESIPKQLYWLFEMGSGWQFFTDLHGEQWIQDRWNEFGPQFLKIRKSQNEQPFAEVILGKPQEAKK